MKRHLFLGPHHDDVEFGAGAYIAKLVRSTEDQISVAVFGYGDYLSSKGHTVDSGVRASETLAAMRVLAQGNHARIIPMILETFLQTKSLEEGYTKIVADIEHVAAKTYDPDLPTDIYIPYVSAHQDHRRFYDACLTALRPRTRFTPVNIWLYEYPGNLWVGALPEIGRKYEVVTYADVQVKLDALYCHKSQFDAGNNTGALAGPEAVAPLARLRGVASCTNFAECFWLLHGVNV